MDDCVCLTVYRDLTPTADSGGAPTEHMTTRLGLLTQNTFIEIEDDKSDLSNNDDDDDDGDNYDVLANQ